MDPDVTVHDPATPPSSRAGMVIVIAVALATTLGVYVLTTSITPNPTSGLFGTSGTDTFPLKSALASGMLALAALQVYTALWIFGKINRKRTQPKLLGMFHRASGITAIVLSIPVAYNCLATYGFEHFDRRVFVHALAGCIFYGVFAAKIITVRSTRLPGWMLPAAGGTLVTIIFVLWYSAALWYYNGFNSPGLSPGRPAAASAYDQVPAGGGKLAGTTRVKVGDNYFVRDRGVPTVTVKTGTTVQWIWTGTAPHNVTVTKGPVRFQSDPAIFKGSFVKTLHTPGRYAIVCTIHQPSMAMTLIVK